MTISQEVKCMFVWIALVLSWPSIGQAEVPVTIDPQIYKQFVAHGEAMKTSRQEFDRSSAQFKKVLKDKGGAFKSAEDGSPDQINAANGMVDGMLDAIEAQLGPLEKYSRDLARMQAINAKAAKSAKPDKDAVRGNRQEIEAYNDLVEEMEGWNDALNQFNAPALKRNTEAMRASLRAMNSELRIVRANDNRFTAATFKKIDALMLDYRLRLNDYVRNLKGMVSGIVQARQAGQFSETIASLENLFADIDGILIPEFLGPIFGKAIEVISKGQTSAGSDTSLAGGATESFDSLYIKD